MTRTWYRAQSADRNPADLLNPDLQYSYSWIPGGRDDDAETTRHGISVCDSLQTLITYLAGPGEGIGYGNGDWVIIELTGTPSEDTPLDPDEYLVHPDTIVSVQPMDDQFFAMIIAAYDALHE